jgi:uncharacterized Ntn-hydrolase superfamily protein
VTLSIAARCERTGMFGIGIASSSPAVGARCVNVRAGVGAVASQNFTDPRLGKAGLDLLARGLSAPEAVAALRELAGADQAWRQLLAVDRAGRTAAFTGARALGIHAHCEDRDAVAAGNALAGDDIPRLMVERFGETASEQLADRLLDSLDAGLEAGGEQDPLRSAALVVADQAEWPIVDLRVDWSSAPLAELRRLWTVWQPEMDDYLRRGLDPASMA